MLDLKSTAETLNPIDFHTESFTFTFERQPWHDDGMFPRRDWDGCCKCCNSKPNPELDKSHNADATLTNVDIPEDTGFDAVDLGV